MSVLIGNLIKIQATFKDEDGEQQDPQVVQVRIKDPNGNASTYIYGTDPEVVHAGIGVYYVEIDTTSNPGTYQLVWNSSGTYQAAGQTEFTVEETLF